MGGLIMTTTLSPLLQSFFTERLMSQRQASPHTIASYRDTFRLLLAFAEENLSRPPSKLTLDDLNAPFVDYNIISTSFQSKIAN